jgi:hypothetical protein
VFHFENFWVKARGFRDIVKEAWQGPVPGRSSLNVLFYKLQGTTKALKSWSKKYFGNMRIQLHMANEIVHGLDVA